MIISQGQNTKSSVYLKYIQFLFVNYTYKAEKRIKNLSGVYKSGIGISVLNLKESNHGEKYKNFTTEIWLTADGNQQHSLTTISRVHLCCFICSHFFPLPLPFLIAFEAGTCKLIKITKKLTQTIQYYLLYFSWAIDKILHCPLTFQNTPSLIH